MSDVSKEDIYIALSDRYGWLPTEIADMNPHQQVVYCRGPKIGNFDSVEAYKAHFGK